MKKWTCWLEDPLTDKGKYIDCPSSIGEKSVLQDMYWKLKKSESVAEQELAQNFSRRQSFAAIIQIVKDTNNPDAVGKLMIWNFGVKVYNKIQEQMQPEFGTPHIPFDLFTGKPFHVKITKVSGYNNYDSCRFLDDPCNIMIDGKSMDRTPENMQTILKYLQENSPNLDKFDFTPWTEETVDYVNGVIQNCVPGAKVAAGITQSNKAQKQTNTAPVVSEDPLAGVNSTSNVPSMPEPTVEATGGNDDDFDMDLYDDL